MSKKIKISMLAITSIFSLLVILFYQSSYSILAYEDILYRMEEKKHPAISIPSTGQKYFNEWKCFREENIKILEVTLDYTTAPRVLPALEAKVTGKALEFDIDPSYKWNKGVVIKKWNELTNKAEKICILAAYLQTDPDQTSVWMITKIKTNKGSWDISDHAQYTN